MNSHFQLATAALLCISLVSGCGREQTVVSEPQETKAPAKNAARIEAASPFNPDEYGDDAVLVRHGVREFTMGEARELAHLRAALARISSPNISAEAKLEESYLPRILASIPYGFPRDCAIAAFAEENGIAATDGDVETMRKNAMQGAGQDFISWGAFERKLSAEERKTLDDRVKIEALTEAVRRWHAANNPAQVTDEELAEFRRRQKEYNAMAAATNDLTFAQATNVWNEIMGGLAFEDAANKYSTDENETEDGEWGDFRLDFFNDEPELKALVATLRPGDITPPVEGDNGLMILRLDDKREEGGQAQYSLSRVFFHLPEFYPELDDETFAKEIRAARQNRVFEEFIGELTKKLPVTYPAGERIFDEAQRTAAQPVMF